MSQHKGIVKNCLWNGLNVKWRITGKSMCFCIIHYWFNVKSRLFFMCCTAGAKHEKRWMWCWLKWMVMFFRRNWKMIGEMLAVCCYPLNCGNGVFSSDAGKPENKKALTWSPMWIVGHSQMEGATVAVAEVNAAAAKFFHPNEMVLRNWIVWVFASGLCRSE